MRRVTLKNSNLYLAICGNSSFRDLGFLSSNTLSAYHLEPNSIILIKIGNASLPFGVNIHRTIFGDLCSSVRLIYPDFSNSSSLIERTLGVSPGVTRSIWLNLSILRKPIFRRTNSVHLRPSTPRLDSIGQFFIETDGKTGVSKSIFKAFCTILLFPTQLK